MFIISLTLASIIWWLFCARGTWELSAACVMPMQTTQVLAGVSSVRCVNNLVDSKGTSHAFTIRHVLVPAAEGSQKPTSAVTPCYFCLWCLPWFPEEEFANTGPRSNMFIYAEYHYLTLLAFPFPSVGPFAKQCYWMWVKTAVWAVMFVWQYRSQSEMFGSGGAKTRPRINLAFSKCSA